MTNCEQKNWITRKNYDSRLINYAGRLTGLAGAALFTACGIEWLHLTQYLDPSYISPALRFAVFDIAVGGFLASTARITVGDKPKINFEAGYAPISIYELTEKFGTPGIYSPLHIFAYIVGALAWAGYDRLPKQVYNFRISKPFYRVLRIQDQRDFD